MLPGEALRNDWESFGISPEVRGLIPVTVAGFWPGDRPDCLVFQTEQGFYTLWIHCGREATVASLCQLMQIAAQNSFAGFLNLTPFRDGRTYLPLAERYWIYLTKRPELRDIHFHDLEDIRRLIGLVSAFRKFTSCQGMNFGKWDRTGVWQKMKAATGRLQTFRMLAQHRIRPTEFDRLFLDHYPELFAQAAAALQQIEASAYPHLAAAMTVQDMALYRLTRHNLGITPSGQVIFRQPEECRHEVPIVDLGFCMAYTGRVNAWHLEWAHLIMTEYQKTFPIDAAEFSVLHALLSFPWSLYRLCCRYYYNLVNWSVAKLVLKLERLLADETLRREFVTEFRHFPKNSGV